MKKKFLCLLIYVSFFSFGQETNCPGFKEGVFTVSVEKPKPLTWRVVRAGSKQREYLTVKADKPGEEPSTLIQYGIITWLDDCFYKILFDDTIVPLTNEQKFINNSGGVYGEVIKIIDNCYFVEATTALDGKQYKMQAKMCKEQTQ